MIRNKKQLLKLYPLSGILLDLAEEALDFLHPEKLINQHVKLKDGKLVIDRKIFCLNKYKRIFIVGAGKATYQMAIAMNKLLKNKITSGYINVPKSITKKIGKIVVNQAFHPLPNSRGVVGAKKIIELAINAKKDDLIICLLSGGGSALLPLPHHDISLSKKIILTKKLLDCSADIHEINCLRKHLSSIKGGRLAQAAWPATVISLCISDVIGNDLNTIASGPTVADSSTGLEAQKILKKYKLFTEKLGKIVRHNESPKKLDKQKVFNYIIGNNEQVLKYLIKTAKKNKLNIKYLGAQLNGEAKKLAEKLASIAKKAKKNTLIIGGGETTVKVKGNGYGGRNQELILAILPHLANKITALSLATDGVDGITPKPVAGAIIDDKFKKIPCQKYLNNNDSYTFLKKIHSLLYTGLTGTNVGDIIMLLKN